MRKLLGFLAVSILLLTSGCAVYHAPWNESNTSYEKAPVYKETKVYQRSADEVNAIKAPVLVNENKSVKKTVQTKKATVLKEKVIRVNAPVNTVPNVSSNVITNVPIKKEVLIIPIE